MAENNLLKSVFNFFTNEILWDKNRIRILTFLFMRSSVLLSFRNRLSKKIPLIILFLNFIFSYSNDNKVQCFLYSKKKENMKRVLILLISRVACMSHFIFTFRNTVNHVKQNIDQHYKHNKAFRSLLSTTNPLKLTEFRLYKCQAKNKWI